MKQQQSSKHKNFPRDEEERPHHTARVRKTQSREKANNAIDRALKRKDLRNFYDFDDDTIYH